MQNCPTQVSEQLGHPVYSLAFWEHSEGANFSWTRQQGAKALRPASMRLWSRESHATNHEACRQKMAAMAMAHVKQNDCRPGRT